MPLRRIVDLLDHDCLAWCEIGEAFVFLDVAADRYFRLPYDREQAFRDGLEGTGGGRYRQPSGFTRPPGWKEPCRSSAAMLAGGFRLGDVARTIWVQRRIERRLASRPFRSVLLDLCRLKARGAVRRPTWPAPRIIRAFEHSRLLRTAADRCLPRSIALASCLAAQGQAVTLAIGVKLAPFGAHCWVQAGKEVLNESVEEVRRYTPILVL